MTRILLATCFVFAWPPTVGPAKERPKLTPIRVKSTLDGSQQPSLLWAPADASKRATPLFVFLHSWSGNYKQNNARWLSEAAKRGWIFLHPNFRGRNDHPEACGSKLARRDILDAIEYVGKKYRVDQSRIYLAGVSGGGHMAMLMAGHHPQRFSAVSAWVGISDLAAWYRFHARNGKPGRYAKMIVASLGAAPGKSKRIDAEYKDRSPLYHLHRVGNLPVEICAGVKDGKTGSVPIMHSLNAFNVIAKAASKTTITKQEIDELWNNGKLTRPSKSDQVVDASYGRDILLRRYAGASRVTIFQGGHEGLPQAAVKWLATKRRLVKTASLLKVPFDFTVRSIPNGKLKIFRKQFTQYLNVFGVHLFATAKTPPEKLQHAAVMLAEYLDNDEDGRPDNPQVVATLVKRQAFLFMTENERALERLDHEVFQDAGFHHGQAQFGTETNPKGRRFDATLEEVLHLITHEGYANVYPQVFGERPGTQLAKCLDRARGGHFRRVPQRYPKKAWFTYDDTSCDYGCQCTEYLYWAITSVLGAQQAQHRRAEIAHEWRLYNRKLVRTKDPHIFRLITNREYKLPTRLPNGIYRGLVKFPK